MPFSIFSMDTKDGSAVPYVINSFMRATASRPSSGFPSIPSWLEITNKTILYRPKKTVQCDKGVRPEFARNWVLILKNPLIRSYA